MNLTQILSTRRGHNSVGDFLFRADLLRHLAPYQPAIVGEDGSIVVKIGQSHVAFSCHIDTCHGQDEPPEQKISIDNGLIVLDDTAGCLGADDGLGIYLMLQLIKQGTPGTYIFHTGEEVGAAASADLGTSDWFCEGIDLIVAFDRAVKPGQAPEVIVKQGGRTCASNECGQALADQLNAHSGLGYVVSDKGVFTDTLHYADNVAECLNVGIYYDLQHSPYEYVDEVNFYKVVEAALLVDWEGLPIRRKVLAREIPDGWEDWGSNPYPYAKMSDYDLGLVEALESAIDGDLTDLRKWFDSPYKFTWSIRTLESAYEDALAGTDSDLVEQYLMVNVE